MFLLRTFANVIKRFWTSKGSCYKCEGTGTQFSSIDGKASKCDWCNGTGKMKRAYQEDDEMDLLSSTLWDAWRRLKP